MYIEIKVYEGSDMDSELYERATAHSLADAEGEIGRIARHIRNDILRGKIHECEDCHNLISFGTWIVGDDDVEVEEGHDSECPKITALV